VRPGRRNSAGGNDGGNLERPQVCRMVEDLPAKALFARTDFEVHVDRDEVSRGRERGETFVLKREGGRFCDAGLSAQRQRRVAVKLGKRFEGVGAERMIHGITGNPTSARSRIPICATQNRGQSYRMSRSETGPAKGISRLPQAGRLPPATHADGRSGLGV
jgi:hypothetical protein